MSTLKVNNLSSVDGSSDISLATPLSGSYRPGEIIEVLAGICDGRSVTVDSGTYALANSSQQIPSTTYIDFAGSTLDYTPPAGTNTVIYEFNFHIGFYATNAPLYHLRFYYDSTEVTIGRFSQYTYYDTRNHYKIALSLNNSTEDIANAKIGTWNTAKGLKLQIRSYTTSFRPQVHSTYYWDGGTSANHVRPTLSITSIA